MSANYCNCPNCRTENCPAGEPIHPTAMHSSSVALADRIVSAIEGRFREWLMFGEHAEAKQLVAEILTENRTTGGREDLLESRMQTALVFAARYAHDRATGGAFAVVCALESCWHRLTQQTKDQIISESREAACNSEDWERLRAFAVAAAGDKW